LGFNISDTSNDNAKLNPTGKNKNIKMKHIKEYDEYLNEQKYKLGDKWSNDFDYVGMLEMGAKAKASMGVKKLQSLFDSFEDVNYHSEASPLSYAIDELKDGNKAEANRLMKEFNKNCEDTLKTYESFINEANIPSNIRKFAKERGVLRDVQQIARWAEKAGERIVGGTAIGRGYDTLVLDLTYDGSEIYFDTDEGTIEVNGQPVDSWESFSKAVNESVNEETKVNEEYVEVMDMPKIANALGEIQIQWEKWKNGPLTEPSDIRPAQKELKGWIDRWFKQNIK